MNTLRDTDEGRPKPSVWPVYVVAVLAVRRRGVGCQI